LTEKVFDDDPGDPATEGEGVEEPMVLLGWEHPSGCPPEISSVEFLADLLFGSLVSWPDVIAMAVPEHLSEKELNVLAADLAAIFSSRYPPVLLILAGPLTFIRVFEFHAPAFPHLQRALEMDSIGGESCLTVVYKVSSDWIAKGILVSDVNGEILADDIRGAAVGQGCVLVGNGPSLNVMNFDENFSRQNSRNALRILANVSCVVGANKFWLGSAKFGFQPSIFVAQDVHVMQVTAPLIVANYWIFLTLSLLLLLSSSP
jgi:hypothetical protein